MWDSWDNVLVKIFIFYLNWDSFSSLLSNAILQNFQLKMKNIGQFSRIEMLFNFPGQLLIELLLKTLIVLMTCILRNVHHVLFFQLAQPLSPLLNSFIPIHSLFVNIYKQFTKVTSVSNYYKYSCWLCKNCLILVWVIHINLQINDPLPRRY